MEPEMAGAAIHDTGASSEPAPSNRRWTVRRKAAIVEAVRSGRVSLDAICQAYKLSIEEFLAWERDMDRYGVPGLRATRYQIQRDAAPRGRVGWLQELDSQFLTVEAPAQPAPLAPFAAACSARRCIGRRYVAPRSPIG
jgi:Protein of unknown function (DUF1153)